MTFLLKHFWPFKTIIYNTRTQRKTKVISPLNVQLGPWYRDWEKTFKNKQASCRKRRLVISLNDINGWNWLLICMWSHFNGNNSFHSIPPEEACRHDRIFFTNQNCLNSFCHQIIKHQTYQNSYYIYKRWFLIGIKIIWYGNLPNSRDVNVIHVKK